MSRKILGMIVEDVRSDDATIQLIDEVREDTDEDGEILEVVTDHGAEFYANKRDADGYVDTV